MNISLILGTTMLSFALGLSAWRLLSGDKHGKQAIRLNLNRGTDPLDGVQHRDLSSAYRLGLRFTPVRYKQKLNRLLALAGRPASMPIEKLLLTKLVTTLASALLAITMISAKPTSTLVLLGIFLIALGYFLPDLMLYSKGLERQQKLQLELANTLDQMLISVEAGLGFEAAMARSATNGKGPLAEELVRTLQDMQMGRSRREAYVALADRTHVPELRSFVKAIVQADAYGIALGKVLRTQAKVMRVARRQRAEEQAMKLPVKVLFPLLFCIFPVLFITVLGPAVLNIMDTFAGF